MKRKNFTKQVRIDAEMHRKLKLVAVRRGKQITDLVNEAVAEFLRKKEGRRSA